MLDHVYIGVSDLDRSAASTPARSSRSGCPSCSAARDDVAFGRDGKPWLFIRSGGGAEPVHIAFTAPDRPTVDRFHAAALASGGRDNGAPGPRPYHPRYYGAFVLDPDGHNIEAVCHL